MPGIDVPFGAAHDKRHHRVPQRGQLDPAAHTRQPCEPHASALPRRDHPGGRQEREPALLGQTSGRLRGHSARQSGRAEERGADGLDALASAWCGHRHRRHDDLSGRALRGQCRLAAAASDRDQTKSVRMLFSCLLVSLQQLVILYISFARRPHQASSGVSTHRRHSLRDIQLHERIGRFLRRPRRVHALSLVRSAQPRESATQRQQGGGCVHTDHGRRLVHHRSRLFLRNWLLRPGHGHLGRRKHRDVLPSKILIFNEKYNINYLIFSRFFLLELCFLKRF